jgi:alpha-glucoside transport system substrate-binding protein
MTRQRVLLLALFALPLVLLAAGCGGGKKKSSGGTTSQSSNVKGTISMVAVWTGAEQTNFQAVLDGFKKKYPNVTVNYKSAKDPGQVISTAVAGGNPPDLAALPSPGLVKDFQGRGALKSLDFAASTIQANYPAAWQDVGKVNGKLYGMVFKGANKSTVWYNVKVFKDAGVQQPKTWDDLVKDAKTIKASGVDAYSIGGADGWTLTDLFENIYLRQAGADKYDQLTQHKIPWTDPSVKTAFQTMAQVIGDTNNIAGGTTGALQADFPTSVTQVFSDPPKAAQVFEGDFVAGVITDQTKAQPKTGFDEYAFPEIGSSGVVVMGGGDIIVMFKDNPAAQALVKYLATPEAATIWAKKGGFSSPNKNVDPSVYPDDITRNIATAMTQAKTFRFDMSDQAPAAFGGDAEFTGMQKFLKSPTDVDSALAGLEAAAKKAYK